MSNEFSTVRSFLDVWKVYLDAENFFLNAEKQRDKEAEVFGGFSDVENFF